MKTIFASKTFWVQVASVLSLAIPQVRQFLDSNPVEFLSVLGAINVLVRFATSGKVSILGDTTTPPSDSGETGSGGVGTLPLLIIGTAAALLCAPPSCSSAGYPLTGSITIQDPGTGAKGGLTFTPGGTPKARIAMPITDSNGQRIGFVDVTSAK